MKPATIILSFLFQVLLQEFALGQKPELVLPEGHAGFVFMGIYSPDGKIIATSANDMTIKIWDSESGRFLKGLEGTWFSFSPDSRSIVACSPGDNTIRLWDLRSGKLQKSLVGHTGWVGSAFYSPDGKQILTASGDSTAIIWDANAGTQLMTLRGHGNSIKLAIYSPDGSKIITQSNNIAKIWDAKSGRVLNSIEGDSGKLINASFNIDSKTFVSVTLDSVKVWDANSGKLIKSLDRLSDPNHDGTMLWNPNTEKLIRISSAEKPYGFKFSSDGKRVGGLVQGNPKFWDAQSGSLLGELKGHKESVTGLEFSPDGRFLVTVSMDKTAKIWDVQNSKLLFSLEGPSGINYPSFSPDGTSIVVPLDDGRVKIWDARIGGIRYILNGHHYPAHAKYSPDGKKIVTTGYDEIFSRGDKTANIWDTQNGSLLQSLQLTKEVPNLIYSPNSKTIAAFNPPAYSPNDKLFLGDTTLQIWDAKSGELLYDVKARSWNFSSDGNHILTISTNKAAEVLDSQTGRLLQSIGGTGNEVLATCFSPDNQTIITGHKGGTGKLWHFMDGKLINTLKANFDGDISFSPDGKTVLIDNYYSGTIRAIESQSGRPLFSIQGSAPSYDPDGKNIVTGANENTANVWNAKDGKLVTTISRNRIRADTDWKNKLILGYEKSGVISLFDLRSGNELVSWITVDSTNWVVTSPSGLFDASPGAMDKLYFVSNLDITELNQLKARYYEPGLWRKIMNGEKLRSVLGFDKVELPPDIRVGAVDEKGNLPVEVINRGGGIGEVTLFINGKEAIKDLRLAGVDTKSPTLSFSVPVITNKNLIPGTENFITVKAWNAGQWIESRGTVVKYAAPAKKDIKPSIFILVCGVSDYTGDEIDLKFASKDAENIGRALELGAKRLFGADKSYVYMLTTSQKPDHFPTKANILKTFEKISTTAASSDVIVVYFSGHGINLGGADGDFYYLTQDAYTASASAYNDPAIRQQATLSSQEMVELFKKVPALKQVLIIDACASGKVVDNLMAKRDIESGTLRALDRMKDRTGMHIITGCTADAVSYEASRYGEGVLTYSLLEGLRGLALREDKYADVSKLFQFAQERVPVLASGIGGIQTPQVFSPNGSQSFDFGELSIEDKKQIPIAKERPVYIRSTFIEKTRDVLGLGKKVDEMLNETASRGESSPLLFTDVSEYPEGCQLSGQYKLTEGKISLTMSKTCDGKEVLFNIEAKDEKDLIGKIKEVLSK